VQTEKGLDGLVALVCIDNLGDRAHRHLGRQAEAFSDGVVHGFLECELVGQAFAEGDLGKWRRRLR